MSTPSTRAFIESLRRGDRLAIRQDESIDWAYLVGEVGDGPLSGDLFQAICALSELQNREHVLRLFIGNLRDPGGAQEVVALLCGGLEVPEALLKSLFDGLRALAFERQKHYGVRAAALKGALYLGQ